MFLSAFIALALPAVLPSTNLPPPVFQVTGLEKAVVTIELRKGNGASWKPIQTPDGWRVRVSCGNVTLDAERMTIKTDEAIYKMQAMPDGRMLLERIAIDEAAPRAKKP